MLLLLLLTSKVIVASIPPIAALAGEIAGDSYQVYSLLNNLQNPHTYELKPQDFKRVLNSNLYFEVGGHIESWGTRLRNTVKNSVVLTDELRKRKINFDNPHIWLDPYLVPEIAKIVYEKLCERFPENSSLFTENYHAFLTRFDSTSNYLMGVLSEYKSRKVLLYHPSWNKFLEFFGITVAGALVHHGEKEISAGEYAKWVKKVKDENISIVVTESNMPSRIPQSLSRETGICLVSLDPLFSGDFINGFKEQALRIYKGFKCQK